jgi:hypothetical protein
MTHMDNMDNEIQLGDVVKDRISGFSGVVIGITQWMYGCRRISVQPQELKDGKPIEHVGFDEPQLVLLERGAFKPIATTAPIELADLRRTGGPRPEPSRRLDPTP